MSMRNRAALLLAAAACAPSTASASSLSLQDLPAENKIRLTNRSKHALTLYYGYVGSFGELQMFFIRFRDRNGSILPVADRKDGWFTPKMHSSSLEPAPRRSFVIPARGYIDFPRAVGPMASSVRWGGQAKPPCQIQLKLFAYKADRGERRVNAMSGWRPGPCPWVQDAIPEPSSQAPISNGT